MNNSEIQKANRCSYREPSSFPVGYSENIMEPLSLEMGLPREASRQVVPPVTDRMS